MTDDLKARGSGDTATINLNEEHDVRYWTTALGVPEDELRRLVAEAGTDSEAVRAALAKKNPPSIFIER